MAQNSNYIAKVSEKGAISLYGLRRFPITFYEDEWNILFDLAPKIKKFAKDNKSSLKDKTESGGVSGGTKL